MSVAQNLLEIKRDLPNHVTLVAVSKTKPVADLMEAYNAGQRVFGENKIQEMANKSAEMPNDIEWHMIGHVQTNKVKYMAPFVSLIHGVDSFKLLEEINRQAKKNNRTIDCLLQMHIAREDTKFGLDENELYALLDAPRLNELNHVVIRGLMGMASFTDDNSQVASEFTELKNLFDKISPRSTVDNIKIETLSMGMSGDYKLAIECGSTMVRIGSSIFGTRGQNL